MHYCVETPIFILMRENQKKCVVAWSVTPSGPFERIIQITCAFFVLLYFQLKHILTSSLHFLSKRVHTDQSIILILNWIENNGNVMCVLLKSFYLNFSKPMYLQIPLQGLAINDRQEVFYFYFRIPNSSLGIFLGSKFVSKNFRMPADGSIKI